MLAPGAFAHAPLEHRLHELKVRLLSCTLSRAVTCTPHWQCPVSFIYGAHDWMDPAGAARARARIEQRFNRSKGDEGAWGVEGTCVVAHPAPRWTHPAALQAAPHSGPSTSCSCRAVATKCSWTSLMPLPVRSSSVSGTSRSGRCKCHIRGLQCG